MTSDHRPFALALLISLLPAVAVAAGPNMAADQRTDASSRPWDVVLELGPGVAIRPDYEGARSYGVSPTGFFSLHYLWLPGLGTVKSDRVRDGFSFGPSFRYVRKRDSDDAAVLRGLNDIDAAYELGGKVGYRWGLFHPWIAVRQGFGGHGGIVAEAGFDVKVMPTAATEFAVGPRASVASSDYMKTYFGVTPFEAVRSGLAAYDPGAGIKGVGAQASGRYEFMPQWAVVGEVAWERLIGDASRSPIVRLGEENQISARIGVTYRFGLKLFND